MRWGAAGFILVATLFNQAFGFKLETWLSRASQYLLPRPQGGLEPHSLTGTGMLGLPGNPEMATLETIHRFRWAGIEIVHEDIEADSK